MTTRERIFTLFEAGTEPHIIAATLGLDVTDVAETLAIPSHEPAAPSGGGGGPAVSVNPVYLPDSYQGLAADGTHLYWANFGNKLYSVGVSTDDPVTRLAAEPPHPINCIAVEGNFLYFTYGSTITHFVGRCQINGEEYEPEWKEFPSNVYGLAVINGELWLSFEGQEKIMRCDLEGEGLTEVVAVEGEPDSVSSDGEFVYWGNETTGYVGRALLDGSAPEQKWAKTAGEPDSVRCWSDKVYWADPLWEGIGRAAIDGSLFEPEWLHLDTLVRGVLPRQSRLYYAAGNIGLVTPALPVSSALAV